MSVNISDSVLYCDSFQKLLGENVLQVLKCGICLEFYENPVVLPCGHTFCYNCLLQMGKHANRNKNFVAVHDLTIGCPNCRCPIFVIALLKRDVTLNYPIQSLIDGLKARQDVKTNMVDAFTNTESEQIKSEEQMKITETIPFVSSKEFEDITKTFDRFTSSLRGDSIINDAFFTIEKIRNEYLESECSTIYTKLPIINMKLAPNEEGTSGKFRKPEDKDFLFTKSSFQSKISREDVSYNDPAIVSYSVGGSGMNIPQPEHLSIY